jgi:polyisoprenoid-binding protein YceI
MSSDGTTTWTIDPSHSLVEFTARHMMITRVKGRFSGVSGTVVTSETDPSKSSVNVEIEAASIDTREEKRDGHLRSGDFLDVENFPHLTFRSTRIEGNPKSAGDSFTVQNLM